MKTSMICALALVLGACAPPGGTMGESMGVADAAIRTGNQGSESVQDVQITTRPGLANVIIDAPADRVWAVLPAVFAELGIPLSQTDPAQKLLSAQNARISRIGGRRLSTYFRCGGVYGDNADGGNAFVSARTQVFTGSGGETVARIEVRAAAAGEGTTMGECGSTGLLEKAIGDAIRAKVEE